MSFTATAGRLPQTPCWISWTRQAETFAALPSTLDNSRCSRLGNSMTTICPTRALHTIFRAPRHHIDQVLCAQQQLRLGARQDARHAHGPSTSSWKLQTTSASRWVSSAARLNETALQYLKPAPHMQSHPLAERLESILDRRQSPAGVKHYWVTFPGLGLDRAR
jgi:hypothetical protein